LTKGFIKISFGIIKSLYFIIKYRPDYIYAFGGYATFPMLIASVLTNRKIILHEQNAHLGKVNRIFAKFARALEYNWISIGYPISVQIEDGFVRENGRVD
jgi:UDP-N-acetylglucosamine--N-acetylmuramyl-(pentapeptide) pyrophosphoryl-undecaprenol N-acetylglucosamine transferase